MISLETETERTLFFDFLPLDLGKIGEYKVRFHLYTVPGQVFYDASRKLILKGADGVVFVGDSQEARAEANIESLENLEQNLGAYKMSLGAMPHVVQYNKRDMPAVLSVDELRQSLNLHKAPDYEAVAKTGAGVFETLKGLAKLVLNNLAKSGV
jgi:signal recognition particle receptor subunit beta